MLVPITNWFDDPVRTVGNELVGGGERVGRVFKGDVERAKPWHRAWSRADPCGLTDLADPFDFPEGSRTIPAGPNCSAALF